jgi:carboxypeptidase Q
MMKRVYGIFVVAAVTASFSFAQMAVEKIDTAAISKIKDEGMNRSQVMETLSYLSDVYGPRLAGSPEYKQAADWVSQKFTSWGLQNVHYEKSAPFAKGWTLKQFSACVLQPRAFPLIACPKAWSPGLKGTVTADVVYLDASTPEELNAYKGKLRGKFVLISEPEEIEAHFEADARRLTDSDLLKMANAAAQQQRRRFRMPNLAAMTPAARDSALRAMIHEYMPDADSATVARILRGRMRGGQALTASKLELCQKEGAAAALDCARGDDGTVFVAAAAVPQPPGTSFQERVNAYDAKAPQLVPQVSISSENYNRMVRMIEKGQKIRMEMSLDVAFTPADSSFNVIAEIPGTDLKDQVVMLGGHLDSWQAGTGATDDGAGVAACMEAVRIIKTLGLQPRRTIRIACWAGEEEGLLGSRSYVARHFGEQVGGSPRGGMGGGGGELVTKPEHDKLSVYFNDDNGTGKFRGVYLQGNEAARPIFREWLEPFASMGASTLTLQNTGGTDHLSFDGVGLPGFQFIQDPIDYMARTHHSNMDVFDRIQADDMKQAATIMAAFVYNAAMMDHMFPRKPLPTSQQTSRR